jgi:8-oxo-dGTP pyrophosphatase MutT (NUDIX family)
VSPQGYEVTASESLYRGKIISVHRDTLRMPDGSSAEREMVDHQGAVAIVALDAEDNVVLVNQYRPAIGRRLDELPAGLLDVSGEAAFAAAERELAEETNLQAGRWQVLLDLNSSPGFTNEAIRIFLARELSYAKDPDGFVREHEEVDMTVDRVPLSAAVDQVFAGEISNATAVAGLLAAAVGRDRGWQGLRDVDAPWLDRPQATR